MAEAIDIRELNERIERQSAFVTNLMTGMDQVIVGQKHLVESLLIGLLSDGHILLEGVPGLAKTLAIKTLASLIDAKYSRIQFTPDLLPADVIGTMIYSQKEEKFIANKGPVFANFVLADEINRAPAKVQSALLEAMQERQVTLSKETFRLPEPFLVLATQNPIEQEGTYPLPEAQLDRFIFKLDVKFPSEGELLEIVNITTGKRGSQAQKLFDAEKIKQMRDTAIEVPVAEAVAEYAMNVVIKSHPELDKSPEAVKKYVRYGSSPRGAQAIIRTARINALSKGRFNVSYEDIKDVAYDVLRHRIFLNFEALSDGIRVEDIINELLKEEN